MGEEAVRAKAKCRRKLTSGTLLTFLLVYSSHNRFLERVFILRKEFIQSWVHLMGILL